MSYLPARYGQLSPYQAARQVLGRSVKGSIKYTYVGDYIKKLNRVQKKKKKLIYKKKREEEKKKNITINQKN